MNANGSLEPGAIRSARRATGLSQEALARRADCSTGYVRLLESGYQPSYGDVLDRISAALDLCKTDDPPGQAGRLATSAVGGRRVAGPA